MIDRDKTIEKFGYDPDNLKSNSVKLIFRLCESCGKEQIVQFRARDKLCNSCRQRGEKNYWFGKQHSTETRKKMSESGKGRIISKETRLRISKSKLGIPLSEEHKEKLRGKRPDRCGKNHPNYGKQSLKHSKRMSGKDNPMFGRRGEKSPSWKGGLKKSRRKTRAKRRAMLDPNPIELNKGFIGSHGHHINKKYIINIPVKLHKSIYHRQTDGKGMHYINKLAFKYLLDNKENMLVSEETAFYINLMCL